MGISDFSRINGLTVEAARPNARILNAVKSNSNQVRQMIRQKATKASGVASNYTKTYSRKAYKLELSAAEVRHGPYYAKPQ
ncbi:MAG: hypothetical protein HQL67_00440 [Magnetococcales bacterium]|nr:hypothetical protein [Magnetococcales bacterium]